MDVYVPEKERPMPGIFPPKKLVSACESIRFSVLRLLLINLYLTWRPILFFFTWRNLSTPTSGGSKSLSRTAVCLSFQFSEISSFSLSHLDWPSIHYAALLTLLLYRQSLSNVISYFSHNSLWQVSNFPLFCYYLRSSSIQNYSRDQRWWRLWRWSTQEHQYWLQGHTDQDTVGWGTADSS